MEHPQLHGTGADGTFHAEGWLHSFTKAGRTRNGGALRSLRIAISTDTVRCSEKLSYKLITGEQVPITTEEALVRAVTSCQMHTLRELTVSVNRSPRFPATHFQVVEGDCLEAAIDLKLNHGLNPAVLNMASRRHPGGGYKNGAGAQEENLFRRSNYFQSLEDPKKIDAARKWRYPLHDFAGVYSPSVQVFRAAESMGYEFLPAPIALDFIAVAAYSHPELVTAKIRGKPVLRLASEVADRTKDKIRLILNIALHHQHDSVVLSAFGCGAFCNPPDHMAELFHEVLDRDFKGCFKHVSFAIFDDHNSRKPHNPHGNVLPFKRVFSVVTPEEEEAEAAVAEKEENAGAEDEVRPDRAAATGRGRGAASAESGGRGGTRGRNARVGEGRGSGRGASPSERGGKGKP